MTLFDAKPPDLVKERRRRRIIISSICEALLIIVLAFWFRHWPQEHVVDKFFTTIEKGDYETAYALWNSDPEWKQHAAKYSKYTYGQFYNDWGPGGEYGRITKHNVAGSARPSSTRVNVTGLVVKVTVNDRVEPVCLWVDDKPRTIGFSPLDCQ